MNFYTVKWSRLSQEDKASIEKLLAPEKLWNNPQVHLDFMMYHDIKFNSRVLNIIKKKKR